MTAPIVVNDVRRGVHEVAILEDGSDVGVTRAVLDAIGLDKLDVNVGPDGRLWLSDAAGRLSWTLSSDLSLVIRAVPELFPVHMIRGSSGRPADTQFGSSPSAFLNYSVANIARDESAFFELGANRGKNRFESTLQWDSLTGAERGLSRLIHERVDRRDAIVLGDDIALSGDILAGSPVVGGLTWRREFGLDPYYVTSPRVGFEGSILTPSTAEIYINGTLTRSIPLPPGPFQLSDLPVPVGPGIATVLVRDAFGNVQSYENPYHFSPALFGAGISDFSYSVGALRSGLFQQGDYEDLVLVARHRRGITDRLTVGGRVEATEHVQNLGANSAFIWRGFEMDSGIAVSRSDDHEGWGVYGSLYRRTQYAGFGFNVVARSDEYATTTLNAESDRPVSAVRAFAGSSIGTTSAILSFSEEQFREREPQRNVALNISRPISARAAAFVRVARSTFAGTTETAASVGFTLSIGRRRSLGTELSHDGTDFGSRITLQQAEPFGEGYSYQVSAVDLESANGSFSYDLPWVRLRLDASGSDENSQVTGSVAGGLVWLDGDFRATQPVTGSFGIAEVADREGVRVYVANQYVGRTGRDGKLFLPRLLPYYANRVSIEDTDIPVDYRIDGTEFHVAPPRLGGTVIEFPVARITAFTGRVAVRRDQDVLIPSFGEVRVLDGETTVSSPVGRDGEFYFENLSTGAHPAEIVWKNGRCEFSLVVPEGLPAFGDVGTVICKEARP